MRIAALYDIHGNLPALEAVLQEVAQENPDLIVVGGDVASGPLPRATLDRLRDLGDRARFISGNADRELVSCIDGDPPPARLPAEVRAGIAWAAGQLSQTHRDVLAHLPTHLVLAIDGLGEVLFCHGSPRSDEEIITRLSPEARVREALRGVAQRVVVCGHTHMQFDRWVGAVRLINAGSVGMPYGEPGAYWALLGPDVQRRRTLYDVDAAAARIYASGYPQAREFAEENVRRPPTEAAAIAVFEQMAAQEQP